MDLLSHPNPALKQRCPEFDPAADESLRALVDVMQRMMREAPGIGLAAPQIGVQKRVFVYDLEDGAGAMCNPVIVERSEETEVDEEGCLSLPGISVPIERHVRVVCEGVSPEGEKVRIEAEGLFARMLQHETDHLDGILIIDRLGPEDRKDAMRRYREFMSG